MYVFDYASTPLGDVDSRVEFRASASNFSDGEQSSGGDTDGVPVAFGDSGGVIGVLEGQIVYRASFVRADGDRLMGRPAGWLPRRRVLFLHGGSTALPFRGRGIHTAGVHWLQRNARGLDVAHAVCVVHADNLPARRSVERLGFRVVGEAP